MNKNFLCFLLFYSMLLLPLIGEEAHPHQIKMRVIINPKSGTHKKGHIEKLLRSYLKPSQFDYEVIYTEGPGHGTELSKEAAALGYDLVLAIGGDGTVDEVGKGLIGTQTAMGIVPAGSGNGFARHLKIPTDPKKALQIINRFNCVSIDTVQINNDYFLGVAGIGFDAHIARKFSNSKHRGFWSYAALVLQDYPSYSPEVFEMEVDGQLLQREGLLVSFANSSQYGNEIKIAPHAKLQDGHMHLVILQNPPFYALPDNLMKLRGGAISSSKYYESICCEEINVQNKRLFAHVDGEPVYFENGIHLKVLPRSLKVLVPPTNPTRLQPHKHSSTD